MVLAVVPDGDINEGDMPVMRKQPSYELTIFRDIVVRIKLVRQNQVLPSKQPASGKTSSIASQATKVHFFFNKLFVGVILKAGSIHSRRSVQEVLTTRYLRRYAVWCQCRLVGCPHLQLGYV